jgi:hypothetical protein
MQRWSLWTRHALAAGLLVMAAAWTDRSATRTLDFAAPRVVGAEGLGFGITDVAVADLDGDGVLDLVTGSRSGWVATFRGKGGRELSPGAWFGASEYPSRIAVADFDGDGRPDVAGMFWAGAVVMHNDGHGAFTQAGSLFPLPEGREQAHAIAAGDFDGDGKADVAVATDTAVHLFSGKGDGGFSPDRAFHVDVRAAALLPADLDGDGRLDLLVVTESGDGVVLFDRAAGLVPGPTFSAGLDASTAKGVAAVGDVDGDGKMDLCFAYHDAARQGVVTLLGGGDGSFRRASELRLAPGHDPSAATLADLDGDGRLDLAVGIASVAAVLALHGSGDGSFTRGAYAGVSAPPVAIAAGDLDGDGNVDLVTAGGYVLTLLPGNGDGTFAGERLSPAPAAARRLVAGDFDGDGRIDCVLATGDGRARYTTMRGDGRGGFRAIAAGSLGEEATTEIAAADLNGDGKLDLVLARRATVLLGEGNGAFFAPRSFSDSAIGRSADRLALGDVDGDGRLDLALVRQGAREVAILLGARDGTFAAERAVDVGAPARHAALADLDGDGKLDLAVGTDVDLRLLYGRGDGTFEPPLPFALGLPVASVAAADLDGDGRIDLVLAHEGRAESTVLRNEGRRAFRPTARVAAGGALAIRDVDGDGFPDLVARSGPVSFLAGNGDGAFAAPRVFGAGDDFALADADGDGLPDLLLIRTADPFLRILRNTSR